MVNWGKLVRVMETDDQLRQWVATWQKAGPALEAVRRSELRALADNRDLSNLDDLLQWALAHAQETTYSGLIEQQRIFKRLRPA